MLIDDAAAAPANSRIVACIPARFGSTRVPGKPLQRVGGVPLVVRVHGAVRRALSGVAGARVVVVTDDARIEDVAASAGAEVWRHDAPCLSGTQRILRAASARGLSVDALLNVQGDQPFVSAAHLRPLLNALAAGAPVATLCAPLSPGDRDRRERVKVVRDASGRALYFSRAAIPGALHVGVYGFRGDVLPRLAALPRAPLADAEDLEQLDWLHAGLPVQVAELPESLLSIDTPEDLAAAEAWLAAAGNP
ncbi:NTP transferase domain-containing protein [Myxococcota bacterium]|nr:NTP transferase domain-containing protein [Myxococcota bacterium]